MRTISVVNTRLFLATITTMMMALFGVAWRRGPVMVTAFSTVAFAAPPRRSAAIVVATTAVSTISSSQQMLLFPGKKAFLNHRPHSRHHTNMALRATSTTTTTAAATATTAAAAAAPASEKVNEALQQAMDVTHPAYEVLEKDVVSEYGAYCTLYRHKKSGAQLLSVANADDNKVFGVTFRTPPEDGTGIAHILEHSVLCGSRKYTTKDPFVHLLKGSLQTFLNAFTYPDRTCYVVASQNEKDFYNLINVYADAVLHPRAIEDPRVLAQEGHHLELEELENKESPLIYNGVVFNEMKGVYSNPDSVLYRASQRTLFPDNTYAVDSGGDPEVIPNLTFEQFTDFHRRFYHPSNARVYFSGDDDVYKRLELMDEYLRDFDALPETTKDSQIKWQPKNFAQPKHTVEYYPAGADQPEKHSIMVNWLLNDKPFTAKEELTLGILDHLLMGTTSSILRKTLMESGLGEAITGGGVSDELLQATFSVGLKGVEKENIPAVETLILDTLQRTADKGFDDDDIAASVNTVEFMLREFNTGSFPKGLSFMLGSMSNWLYERSPTEALKFEKPLAELKDEIAKSGSQVFQKMLQELLIENTHRTSVELAPSKSLEEEQLKKEQERLANIKAKLSDDELDEIVKQAKELKALQAAEDSPEDRATIPSLELADLKREQAEYPIAITENENNSGVTVVRHELPSTSGIAYVALAVDLSSLALDDVPLLSLFTKVMMETGAGEYDSVALSRRIGTYTGGVDVGLLNTAVYPEGVPEDLAANGEYMQTKLLIKGKATSEHVDELFSIFRLILTDAKFDSKSKVIELLKESRSRLENSVQGAGHSIANTRMKARYRVGGYIEEITSGISYLDTVKTLLKQAEEDWPSLLKRLEDMRTTILNKSFCRSGMMLDVTGEAKVLEAIKPAIGNFLNELPGDPSGKQLPDFYKEIHPWVPEAKKGMAELAPIADEGFVVPTQVSYVGKSGLLYGDGERIPGSAQVVARFLRTGYLWDYVRVMGGAYGGFCTFSAFSGFFSFLSYRDPNLDKTLDIYDAAADALMAAADVLENDPDALSTAIIGTIGDLDGALSPDQKGFSQFQRWLINESPENRQRMRDEILATKPEDFREFSRRLKAMKDPSVAVVSSKSKFELAAKAGKKMILKDIF